MCPTMAMQELSGHALSRETLLSAGAPIFLVDTFSALLLYYAVGCPPHMPFPPPQSSLLRRTLNQQRQNRRPTPALHLIRGGLDNVQPFLDCLIEEAELDDMRRTTCAGFPAFQHHLREQAWQYLQALETE